MMKKHKNDENDVNDNQKNLMTDNTYDLAIWDLKKNENENSNDEFFEKKNNRNFQRFRKREKWKKWKKRHDWYDRMT